MVIQMAENHATARIEENFIMATAGCLFNSISRLAAYHSLTGLEFRHWHSGKSWRSHLHECRDL